MSFTASSAVDPPSASAAGVAWIACRYIDFPTTAAGERSAVGAPGGPLGRAVAGLVGGLLRGGAGRDSAPDEIGGAARDRTLAPAKSYVESSSASAASAAGLACAELLAARCPPLREGLARTLDAMLSSAGAARTSGKRWSVARKIFARD